MKKKLFALLLLAGLFNLQTLQAVEENNPPKCPPHDYGDSLYDCSIGGSVTTSQEERTATCNTTPSTAVGIGNHSVSVTGQCLEYCICRDCSDRLDKGSAYVGKTASLDNPNTEANGTLKPGWYSVDVRIECHRVQHIYPSIYILPHNYLLFTPGKTIACYMSAEPAYSSYIGYVQYQNIKIPVGLTYRFGVNWLSPASPGTRAGKNVFGTYYCPICFNFWDFPQGSEKVATHHEKFPDPQTTGEEIIGEYYPYEVRFPNLGRYGVSFTKECESYLHTFSGWNPQDITIGSCSPYTYNFTLDAIGVESLISYNNFYDRGDNHWYILTHIDPDPDPEKNIIPRTSILNLLAASSSGDWPTIDPYYNPIYNYDPLDPDKGTVKYPKWSCSPPANYTQPNNYEFYCGNPPSTDVDGSTSVNFKGKSYGIYTIAASCGTDVHQDADPYNNIAKKTKWVHAIDPKVKVDIKKSLCTIVDEAGQPSAAYPPIKAVSLDCGECSNITVDLKLDKNGVDIGNLQVSISSQRLFPDWDLPEYELYADSEHKIPLTQMSVTVDETDTTHQLYTLATGNIDAIYIVAKSPGYITVQLSYTLGSYISETHKDKIMILPTGCTSSNTCTMPNPTANVDSIDYRFNLGNSTFGDAGGFFQIKSDTLVKELFSLDNLNIIVGPSGSITYDTTYDGYPTLIDTGLYKTAFTYERDTIGSETFVKKITAQYSQSGSSTILSTIVMSITYDAAGVVSAFNASYTKHVTGGDIVQNWSYAQTDQTCPDLGVTKTFWVLNDDGVNTYVTYNIVDDLKTEYRYIGSITSPAEKIITVQQLFDWGYETISETRHGLTTTHQYYTDTWGGRQGWLKKTTFPRGNSAEYFYDTSGRITRELTLEGGATKETLYTYTDSENKTQTIKKYNTTVVSKTEDVNYYDNYTNPDKHTEFDASDNELVTWTYRINNSSSEYHGKARLVKRPDGTVTVTEYSKANDEETITTYDGVPNDFSSTTPTVTDGIKTVHRTNSAGQTIYSAAWDITTNTKLSEQTAITTDSFGRVTKYQYMDGSYSESTYGCCGVDWEKDRNGVETTYAYNDNGSLNYTVRNGITTLYTYNDLGNTVSTTVKGRNNTELTSTKVYTNGVLTSTTDPMNYTTTYSNNGDTVTYPNGTTSITTYTQGVVTGISGTAVHAQTYTFGPNWRKTMPQDITVYTDMLGRQYKTKYADDTYTETFYNSKGQAVKQVSPAGRITLIEYDSRGRVYRSAVDMNQNSVIDGDDEITQYTYSFGTHSGKTVSVSTVTRIVNTNSKVLSVSETTLDGLESWTTSNGLVTHSLTERLGSGQLKSTVEYPNGSKTVTTTKYGLTDTVENFQLDGTTAGNVIEYEYDEFDRPYRITEKYGETIINQTVYSNYNANGQALTVTTNGRATTYVYDNMGRMTSQTKPGSRTVTYTYKDTGELDTVDGADTYKQAYVYDSQGRMHTLTTYKDANTPQVTTWNYNNRGFMTSKVYADSKGIGYTYTADGQLASRTWARTSSGSPLVTGYTYDNAGRQLAIDYSDTTPDITYTYDWMGNISTVADAEGTRTFTYDYTTSGHPGLASVTVPGIVNHSINYTYDGYGRKTGMSLNNNSTPVFANSYAYNSVTGRIAAVGDGTYTANYNWQDGTGLLTQTQIRDNSDDVITTHNRTYDTRLNNYHLLSASNTTGATTRTYSYEYNIKDQRTKLTLADGTYWEYTYDDKGQVTNGVKYDVNDTPIAGQYFGYNYDMIGNRVWEKDGSEVNQIDYTSNLVNQYTQLQPPSPAPAESLTYDDDGNMTSDGEWTYTYNAENRPVTVINADNTKKFEYKYDYAGRRIEEKYYTSSGTWTLSKHLKFVYKGFKKIAEYDGSDNLLKLYTWQPVGLDVPLWVKDGTNYYYYIADGNKNIRAMVDVSGNEVASYDYKPFGGIASKSGSYADDNMYRFSSEYYCPILKSSDYGLRDYSFILGRWRTRDPIGEKGGYSLYGMTGNDTVNKWDLLGLSEVFGYAVELWDDDLWILGGDDLVARFSFFIQYSCEKGKVKYISPMSPLTKVDKYDLQGAKIDSGIIPKKIFEDGSAVEFTLWAAGSWEEFNKEAGLENAQRIIELFQADKQPRPLIVSIALGVYIVEGNLRAIKRTATFSKKVNVYCCKDGKRGPILETKNDQFKKDGDGDGDLYWKNAEELNMDGSIINNRYRR